MRAHIFRRSGLGVALAIATMLHDVEAPQPAHRMSPPKPKPASPKRVAKASKRRAQKIARKTMRKAKP